MQDNNEKIPSGFLSEILRVKGISIQKLAQATDISEQLLNLLLEEKYEKLPASPYIHGYILKIADVLNMDGEELWLEYKKNTSIIRTSGKHDRLPENRFTSIQMNKKIIVAIVIIAIIILYIAFRIPSLLGGPNMFINFDNNLVVSTSTFVISGKIDPENKLTINGETLYPDKDGKFEKTVKLLPGFNTFNLKTKKFLGGEKNITRQIFFKTSSSTPTKQ